MTQSADASSGVNVSATLTTGEAAQLLTRMCGHLRKSGGFSKQTVRRLITSGDLTFRWSRDEVTRDRRGREIHGHRMIDRASVEAYAAGLIKGPAPTGGARNFAARKSQINPERVDT